MRFVLVLLFGISTCVVSANQQVDISFSTLSSDSFEFEIEYTDRDNVTVQPKFKRLKAVLLALFLGHFGVHRIYLGTAANVPVVYSLTLGGGLGLLPLLDIVAILTTNDLEQYSGNNKVFMWNK